MAHCDASAKEEGGGRSSGGVVEDMGCRLAERTEAAVPSSWDCRKGRAQKRSDSACKEVFPCLSLEGTWTLFSFGWWLARQILCSCVVQERVAMVRMT